MKVQEIRLRLIESMVSGRLDASPKHVIDMVNIYEEFIRQGIDRPDLVDATDKPQGPVDRVKERLLGRR